MTQLSHPRVLALLQVLVAAGALGCATTAPASTARPTAAPVQTRAAKAAGTTMVAAWRQPGPRKSGPALTPLAMLEDARRDGRAFVRRPPRVGDTAFFRDVRLKDQVTLAGVVEQVQTDGTVILAARVKSGVVRLRMNLDRPSVRRDPRTHRVLNHYLAGGRDGVPPRTTAQLFVSYASPRTQGALASR